ncbi:MAG: NIPSNAP family protein [Gemmatales bacterium]
MLRSLLLLLLLQPHSTVPAPDTRCFELRVYQASPGKRAVLNNVLAGMGSKYAARYRMDLQGAWLSADKNDERIFLLIAYPDKPSALKSWDMLNADEEFKADIVAASKEGRPIASVSRFFLEATDYSPAIKPDQTGNRIFELRTYITPASRLPNLNTRFRDHTVKLFTKHNITNLAYFNLGENEKTTVGELLKGLAAKGKEQAAAEADATAAPVALVYFLAHPSAEAMAKNFGAFGKDELWKKAYTESEKVAGGPLTVRNGVKSLVLQPTDYSPWK